MFLGGLTIAINGFTMVFDAATIAFNGFRWFGTIGQTMRWFRWIVVVYSKSSNQVLDSLPPILGHHPLKTAVQICHVGAQLFVTDLEKEEITLYFYAC